MITILPFICNFGGSNLTINHNTFEILLSTYYLYCVMHIVEY